MEFEKNFGPKIILGLKKDFGSKKILVSKPPSIKVVLHERSIPYPKIGLHIKYEPPTRHRTLYKVCCGWWWVVVKRHFRVLHWLDLGLVAWTKLNNTWL